MPNYVCVTVCLVVKTIVVWESNKLPCCWHDLQTLESEAMGYKNGYSYRLVAPISNPTFSMKSREVEEDFMPNYVCVTVCLVVKTIVVWESNKLPCCWHDLQTLESEAMGYKNGSSQRLVAPI